MRQQRLYCSQPRALGSVILACAALLSLTNAAAAAASDGETADNTGRTDEVIEFINERIRQGWADNEVSGSEFADDAEWIRRVYLDVVGHIPPAEAVDNFLDQRERAKRSEVIDRLLDDPGYVRSWTTIWTNLTLGRQTPRRVSREGMEKFWREAFGRNRPWDKVVYDLITAEGHFEENGAVNYLLAQMTIPDDGVQATAKTTRLFMGLQLQCTQCHNHPFNDWKQDQFWQFNSFFRQVQRVDHRRYDAGSGRMVDDYSELVFEDFTGPVFFEKRNGLMQVAYPSFFATEVDPGSGTDRRQELARLMVQGKKPLIAAAMVNRMWGHFFGFGLTNPVDDMGSHNPPSHPKLLDRLTVEFVRSGYNLKELIRWICNSEAYNLTSRFGRANKHDDPEAGQMPLFSRMYVKSMTAEQLFDSLLVATEAHKSGRASWEQAEQQRRRWLQQFVIAFGTDENDETTTFNGTIPQALMMMNGELIDKAISAEPGSYLNRVLAERTSDSERIQKLYLATLSRYPSRREMAMARKLIAANVANPLVGYQDLLWALLNANEFICVH